MEKYGSLLYILKQTQFVSFMLLWMTLFHKTLWMYFIFQHFKGEALFIYILKCKMYMYVHFKDMFVYFPAEWNSWAWSTFGLSLILLLLLNHKIIIEPSYLSCYSTYRILIMIPWLVTLTFILEIPILNFAAWCFSNTSCSFSKKSD